MNNGTFPSIWKISSVTPIYKSGDPLAVTNYCPISILPYLGKLFELVIYNYIKQSLNHILISEQHRFRTGKSTINLRSISFSLYISECLKSGSEVYIIMTDFSKALNYVEHNPLSKELMNLGVGNPFLFWLTSYISRRSQFVTLNNNYSSLLEVSSGGSQGG